MGVGSCLLALLNPCGSRAVRICFPVWHLSFMLGVYYSAGSRITAVSNFNLQLILGTILHRMLNMHMQCGSLIIVLWTCLVAQSALSSN